MHLKIPPLLLAVLFAILMVIISFALPQFSYSPPHKTLVAIFVATFGIIIASAGIAAFRHLQTTANPTKPGEASALAIDGIYRRSRNPMYLGFLLFLVACGIYLANIVALLAIPPAFVVYMNRYQIKPEEEALLLIFGDDFVSYQARVRRWL